VYLADIEYWAPHRQCEFRRIRIQMMIEFVRPHLGYSTLAGFAVRFRLSFSNIHTSYLRRS
jgi:hypothetical protein